MAWRQIRDGNTTRILSEREYEKEQENKAARGCFARLVQLGLSAWVAGWSVYIKLGISNPTVAFCLFLVASIVAFLVLGKIGKLIAKILQLQ